MGQVPAIVRTPKASVRAEKVVLVMSAWSVRWAAIRKAVAVVSGDIIMTPPIPNELEQMGWTDGLGVSDGRALGITLVVAGAETTTFLLANLLYNLAVMPAERMALCRDPALIPAFIDESLRHSGPPQRLFRIATRDVEVGGCLIKAGEWVALFFGAANHDADVFPEPARFEMARENANRHLSMGLGIHHCLGFAVAKLEAGALIEAVLGRFPELRLGETLPVPQRTSLLTNSFEALTINFDG